MINPNELRIGNFISWRDGFGGVVVGTVYEVHADKVAISPAVKEGEEGGQGFMLIAGINPIPFTPEWMGNLGFKNGLIHHFEKSIKISYYDGTAYIGNSTSTSGTLVQIQYVHQFQNLCQSLTGEELTIKETA